MYEFFCFSRRDLFLGMPEIRCQKLFRNLIAVIVTIFLIIKIYGKEHFVFPKNLLM